MRLISLAKILAAAVFTVALNFVAAPAAIAGADTGKVISSMERVFSTFNAEEGEAWKRAEAIEAQAESSERSSDCIAAEAQYLKAFEAKKAITGLGGFRVYGETINPLIGLARCLASRGQYEEALTYRELEWDQRGWTNGIEGEKTLTSLAWIKRVAEEAVEKAPSQKIFDILGRAYANLYVINRQDLEDIPVAARPAMVRSAIDAYDIGHTRDGGGDTGTPMLLLEAALLQQWNLGEQSGLMLQAQSRYADALSRRSRHLDAEYIGFSLVEKSEAIHGPNHPDTIRYMVQHAQLIAKTGYHDDAKQLAEDALALANAHLEPGSPIAALAKFRVASAIAEKDPSTVNIATLTDALKGLGAAFGKADRVTIEATSETVFRLIDAGQAEQAKKLALSNLITVNEDTNWHLYEKVAYDEPSAVADLYSASERATAFRSIEAAQMLVRDTYGGSGLRQDKDEMFRKMRQFGKWGLDAFYDADQSHPAYGGRRLTTEGLKWAQDALKGGASAAVNERGAINDAMQFDTRYGDIASKISLQIEDWDQLNAQAIEQIASPNPNPDNSSRDMRVRRAEIRKQVSEYERFMSENAPAYDRIKFPTWVQHEPLRQMLKSDEAILLLVPTDFGTHSYMMTRTGTRWHRSDWNEEKLSAAVHRLLMDVGANVEMDAEEYEQWYTAKGDKNSFDRGTAHALYKEIIAPHEFLLGNKTHLYVAASGVMTSLPLSVLVTEIPQGEDHDPAALRSTKWLADKMAIVQIPSVNSWAYLRKRNSSGTSVSAQVFAGFGDPVLGGSAETRGSALERIKRGTMAPTAKNLFGRKRSGGSVALVRAADLKKLSNLPGTAIELNAMRSALGAPASAVRLGSQATEAAVKNADLSSVGILTFATHGLIAGELRGVAEPGLVFTPPANPTPEDDGFLTASEIAKLDLNARWVILSACNTASGDGTEGAPGLSGLAQAFFFAGADNLLATHWPVRDDVASKLTVRAIEIDRENPDLSKAQAFQKAMQEIRVDTSADSDIDSWAHPSAWAPFVLIGDR